MKDMNRMWILVTTCLVALLSMSQGTKSGANGLVGWLPGLAALIFSIITSGQWTAAQQPNIIMILADDLGNSDISVYNPSATPLINTPSIDQLASEGIRFTDGRTPDGVCTPTRYGLLTGQYSWRTRLKTNVLNGYSSPLIDDNRMTVASMLQSHGYNTAAFGKWHLGLEWVDSNGNPTTSSSQTGSNIVDFTKPLATGPTDHGFDTSVLYPASLNMAPFVYIRDGQTVMADGTVVTDQSTQMKWTSEYKDEFGNNVHTGWAVNDLEVPNVQPKIADDAAAYVTQQATDGDDSPFFMYVPFTGPHKPVAPSGDFDNANPGANTNNSPYGEFMADIDDSVRKIVDAVDAQGQEFANNTLIIFSSDNGAHQIAFGPNDQHVANAPYRDKKLSAYDGGTRVPFIARWGDKVAPGQVIDERVGLIDLFGTVSDIVGHEIQQDEAEDTASFANILLNGDTTPIREGHVYHSYRGSFAIGSDEWKLFTDAKGGAGGAVPDPSSWQLYNLDVDIDESDNLVNQHPNKAAELGLMIARYEPNAENGRSRTHRQMLARFDLIDFQAGHEGTAANPDVHELSTTNRLAQGVSISQGLKKDAGLSYVSDAAAGDRGDEFHVEGFDGASLDEAKINDDFLSLSLEIDEGWLVDDLLISFDLWRDGADSATHYAVLTSADGFTTTIGELAFAIDEHGLNLGVDYSGGEYGVGNAKTLSGLLDLPDGTDGLLDVRLYGYSNGQSLAGSTHLIGARVEGLFAVTAVPEPSGLGLIGIAGMGMLFGFSRVSLNRNVNQGTMLATQEHPRR